MSSFHFLMSVYLSLGQHQLHSLLWKLLWFDGWSIFELIARAPRGHLRIPEEGAYETQRGVHACPSGRLIKQPGVGWRGPLTYSPGGGGV